MLGAGVAELRNRLEQHLSGTTAHSSVVITGSRVTRSPIAIGPLTISCVDQPHGNILSTGLRFEADGAAIGYATDFHAMTDAMRRLYDGLDLWVVDCLRRRPHPTHPALPQLLDWRAELAPSRTVLTHLDQSMDYATLAAELPPAVEPGYDGYSWNS